MSEVFQGLLPHLKRFTVAGVQNAPAVPGIYAWYSVLSLGPKDWEVDIDAGVDRGIGRLRMALSRHTARFAVPALEVIARGRFTASWRGEVQSDGSHELSEGLLNDQDEEEGAGALAKVLSAPALRSALVRVISAATPVLAAPLYIGVTDDLNRRLGEHASSLQKSLEAVARDPSARGRLLKSDKSFAFRAVGSGFTLDHLEVWAIDLGALVGNQQLSPSEIRTLAEACEWLLNRWHRPLHGKR
jgi:hypothetical protein